MKNKIAVLILSGALLLPISAQAMVMENNVTEVKTFSDVNSQTDYFPAINWAVDSGVATGYADGRWGPNDCVTRAQLVKMVMEARSLGMGSQDVYQNNPSSTFTDVHKTDWFYGYVYNAKDSGVIAGYADGSFKPNKCVNRAESMKISSKALLYTDNIDSSGGPIMYDDKIVNDIKISDWYGPYARLLFKDRLVGTNHTVRVGEISGAPLINFFPAESMSRKEVAQMLYSIQNSPIYANQY